MRIFVTKSFRRFQRRENITDASLWRAIERAEAGLIDAELGGGVIKQRIARPGQGKRAGYRVLAAFRSRERAVFLYGFPKSVRGNITDAELASWRDVSRDLLAASDAALGQAVADDELREI